MTEHASARGNGQDNDQDREKAHSADMDFSLRLRFRQRWFRSSSSVASWLIPEWFTLLPPTTGTLASLALRVGLLDYRFLPPTAHPVRQVLPWYGVLERREMHLCWQIFRTGCLPETSPLLTRRIELDRGSDTCPWELGGVLQWIWDETRRHKASPPEFIRGVFQDTVSPDRGWRLHPLKADRQRADGSFLVFAAGLWLEICPATWQLQEYFEMPPGRGIPAGTVPPLWLRPLGGRAYCPLPEIWNTAGAEDRRPSPSAGRYPPPGA